MKAINKVHSLMNTCLKIILTYYKPVEDTRRKRQQGEVSHLSKMANKQKDGTLLKLATKAKIGMSG